jgi:RNA polymerase sigma-70 factor (ECF subfamily)
MPHTASQSDAQFSCPKESEPGVLPDEAAITGRERAAELYKLYGPPVYRRCLRLLRDKEAAQDATQEVFVKLVRDIDKLDDPAIVLPWMYRVATNHCLNVLRDRGRRGEEPLELEVSPDVAAETPYPDRQLAGAILSLFDERTRAVAVGVLVDGMGHEELAGALGISRKMVERKLARFLQRARAVIAGEER